MNDFIDLDNIENLFMIANCHNFKPDFKQLASIEYDATIKGFLYEYRNNYIVTFTPYDYKGLLSYLKTGMKLLYNQDLTRLEDGGMNSFFYRYSLRFFEDMKPFFTKKVKKIYVTGISMGGAMSQCFYYHLHSILPPSTSTILYTFGSPRIGDGKLMQWFTRQKKLHLKNIFLLKLVQQDGITQRIYDPVCTFPNREEYINNANLYGLCHNKLLSDGTSLIDRELYEFTLCNLFFSSALSKAWEETHNIEEYESALSTIRDQDKYL